MVQNENVLLPPYSEAVWGGAPERDGVVGLGQAYYEVGIIKK